MNKPLYIFLTLVIGGCTTAAIHRLNQSHGVEQSRDRMVSYDSEAGRLWHTKINPMIEKCCALCTIAALRSVSTFFKAEWGIFSNSEVGFRTDIDRCMRFQDLLHPFVAPQPDLLNNQEIRKIHARL